ncbi:MAG: hypothetical protein ACE5PT_00505 [Gemmatimonadales bacterium]
MADLVPRGQRIDRGALERIIRRAAELQASEHEIGEGLTEPELMRLGNEVGIPAPYLRQALMEERTRGVFDEERGFTTWLTGPRRVAASRTLEGAANAVEQALHRWMTDYELLQVKRRYPNSTSWEARKGALALIRRSLDLEGRQYALARAREVVGEVVGLDENRCHVQLVADLSNTVGQHLGGFFFFAGAGTLTTATLLALGFFPPLAVVPTVVAVPAAFGVARTRRRTVERVQVALEQVLDRLEHGDIDAKPKNAVRSYGPLGRLAGDIKKNLGV